MKILFFYQYFGTPKGSWSTRVYELARRWVEAGATVTVVTSPYEKSDVKADGFISHQVVEGIQLIVINSGDSNRLSKYNRVLRSLVFSALAVWYALSRKYDVLISSSGPITVGIPMIAAKKLRRKRTIFEVRDLWPAGGIEMGLIRKKWQIKTALWFEKLCYTNADAVITASVGQKEFIEKQMDNLHIEVIPNASDLLLFGTPGTETLPEWTKNKTLLTHIGSLGFIHNIEYWLKVAKEISKLDKEVNILFVFIGEGAERKKLEELASNLQLNNVKFLGLLPKTNLPSWVQSSAATLFATLDNPVQNTCSPNKIFDSFAAGIPILQTTTGWIGSLVEKKECGINLPLSDPESAARMILKFIQDKEKIKLYGNNAKRLAINDFNRDILAKKYFHIMQNLLVHK